MAKYIGLISTDLRGKIGGVVGTRATTGTTLRRHAAGTNKATSKQHNQRQLLGYISSQWRAQTAGVQAMWQSLASLTTLTNTLGQQYTPSAQQLFMQCNLNYYPLSGVIVSSPPTTVPVIQVVTGITLAISSGALQFSATTGGSGDYPQLKVSLTGALPSLNQFAAKGRARFLRYYVTTDYTVDITSDWEAAFGSLPATMNVKAFVQPFEASNGYPGTLATLATFV